jgi:hypothetical protein
MTECVSQPNYLVVSTDALDYGAIFTTQPAHRPTNNLEVVDHKLAGAMIFGERLVRQANVVLVNVRNRNLNSFEQGDRPRPHRVPAASRVRIR